MRRITTENVLAEMAPTIATAHAMRRGYAGWGVHSVAQVAERMNIPLEVAERWCRLGPRCYMNALERVKNCRKREREWEGISA